MEYGLFVANVEFPRLRHIAQAAESLGYHLITHPDHIVYERAEGQYDPHTPSYDPFIIGAVICEATRKIRVGYQVLCNLFRHPVMTAQSLMSLDHLSGGRVIAGLGSGWTEREFRMIGVNFPDIKSRLRMLDEALTCMRLLWTQEETTFEGEFYRLRDAILWPKPVQKPHPPIMLGGSGRGLLRLAAKHANYVNIIHEIGKFDQLKVKALADLTGEVYKAKVSFTREETRRLGREPGAVTISNSVYTVALTDSRQETEQRAQQAAKMLGGSAEQARRSPLFLIGTPDECVAELKRRVKEWEVGQFILGPLEDKTMRRLAEEVLPHV